MLTVVIFCWFGMSCFKLQAEPTVDFTLGLVSEYGNDALGIVVNPRTRPTSTEDFKRIICKIRLINVLSKLPVRSRSRLPEKKISEYRELRMLFYLNDVVPYGVSGQMPETQRKFAENSLGDYYMDEAGGRLSVLGREEEFDLKECARVKQVDGHSH